MHSSGRPGAGQRHILQSVAVRTDSSGSFLLEGLDPAGRPPAHGRVDGRFSGAAQTARAGPEKKVKLVVSPANTVMLAGRVVDSSGKPVEGAEVRIRSQTRHTQGQVWRVDPVFADFGERRILRRLSHGQGRSLPDPGRSAVGPRIRGDRDRPVNRRRAGRPGSRPAAARRRYFPMSCWTASDPLRASFTIETESPWRRHRFPVG